MMKDVFTYKNGGENKIPFIRGKPLVEIGKVRYNEPRYKGKRINYFEKKTRKHFYKSLGINNLFVIKKLLNNSKTHESVEFNDNVISKFCGQLGRYIEKLLKLREIDDIIEISNLIKRVKNEQLEKINEIRKENSLPLISY